MAQEKDQAFIDFTVKALVDHPDDVKTERAMSNIRKIEIDYGQNIELFSHELTPEFILELKEYCILNNIIVGKLF